MEAYYVWGLKPNESQPNPPMENIIKNTLYFPLYQIVSGEQQIMPYVQQFNKLHTLWNRIPHWVVKADISRYLLIYFHGGFYFDVDCEILKSIRIPENKSVVLFIEKIIQDLDRLGPREIKSEKHKVRIANYAFGAREARDPFIRALIEECIQRLIAFLMEKSTDKISEVDIVWLAGPDVVTSVYHKYTDKSRIEVLGESFLEHHEHGGWRNRPKKNKK